MWKSADAFISNLANAIALDIHPLIFRVCVAACSQLRPIWFWCVSNKFNSLDEFEQEISFIYAKKRNAASILDGHRERGGGVSKIEQPSTTLIDISILYFICAFSRLGSNFRGRMLLNLKQRCQSFDHTTHHDARQTSRQRKTVVEWVVVWFSNAYKLRCH